MLATRDPSVLGDPHDRNVVQRKQPEQSPSKFRSLPAGIRHVYQVPDGWIPHCFCRLYVSSVYGIFSKMHCRITWRGNRRGP